MSRNLVRFGLLLIVLTVTLSGTSAFAVAPPSASCIGQFFSSHAGLGAEHTGETVGSFISATARELGADFGATISSGRILPRDDRGL